MRVFLDTEFTSLELGPEGAELISVGLVTEQGKEFYAEVPFIFSSCSLFVKERVLPLLDAKEDQRMDYTTLMLKMSDWLNEVGPEIVLLSDSRWDMEVLKPVFALVGGIKALCPGLIHYGLVTPQWHNLDYSNAYRDYFISNPGKQHHALHDARALRLAVLASGI